MAPQFSPSIFTIIFIACTFSSFPFSSSIPFILLHGRIDLVIHVRVQQLAHTQEDLLCNRYAHLIGSGVYTDYVQANSAPSGYIKFPNDLDAYLAKCSFLPQLNNELPEKNSTYKERLTSLKNLVLIMFEEDTVVIPRESSWFGFFPDNYDGPIQLPQMTKLYRDDWIGLRTLDETGRLKFISVTGEHLLISQYDTLRFVVPYLSDDGMAAGAPSINTTTQNKRQSQTWLKNDDVR